MSASGDAEFSTGAELTLSIANGQLSSLRSQIENELSDIPVGVDASGVGGGSRVQPRDPATGQFMSIEGVEQRVIEQTEAQVELLDDIKDAVEGGGVGGGGGAGALGGLARVLGPLGLAAGGAGLASFGGMQARGALAGEFPGIHEMLSQSSEFNKLSVNPIQLAFNPSKVGTVIGQVAAAEMGGVVDRLMGWDPPKVEFESPSAFNRSDFGVNDDGTFQDDTFSWVNEIPPGDAVSTEGGDVRLQNLSDRMEREQNRHPLESGDVRVDVSVDNRTDVQVDAEADQDDIIRQVEEELRGEVDVAVDDLRQRLERSLSGGVSRGL